MTSDVIFFNGRFIDPSTGSDPVGDALLARDGKIAAVGSLADLQVQARSNAQRWDLAGRTVIPGIVDSHIHLQPLGESLDQCDLSSTTSRRQAVGCIAAYAASHPDRPWLVARGYQLNAWEDSAYPTARDLDEAVPDRPCIARAFDGHSLWANTSALRAAGITLGTTDPPGGVILRDGRGRPTGYLLENAADLVRQAMPGPTDAQADQALRLAAESLSASGHTGVHVPVGAGDAERVLNGFKRLYPDDRCPLRVRIFGSPGDIERLAELRGQATSGRVQVAGVKCLYDGSLGSRTALMFEPYEGQAGNRGISVMGQEDLIRLIGQVNGLGMPLICHAIGDRACAEALAAFDQAGDRRLGNRLEHAQHLRPCDLDLFRRAGVAASVQPAHLATDWRAANCLLGRDRSRWSLAFRSLLDHGAILAVGSDAPVVPPDWPTSLHAAVTRTDLGGNPPGGWHPAERITPLEWVVAATVGAWQSIGEDEHRGTLSAGHDCDLTVLSGDPFAAKYVDYRRLTATSTIVGGEICWSSGQRTKS